VTVNGRAAKFETQRTGDVQRVEVNVDSEPPIAEVVFTYDEGTEVYFEPESLKPGQSNQGIRLLRARADANALRLVIEGLGGRSYTLRVRSPRRLGEASGVKVSSGGDTNQQLLITFDGPPGAYVRREVVIPMQTR